MKAEWINGAPPYGISQKMDVWMDNDCIREAQVNLLLDYSNLFFTDCKHPLQNSYCHRDNIIAYRIQS